METLLERYNAHKRATLDRLTQSYTMKGLIITRNFYRDLVEPFYESLNDGDNTIKIDISALDKKFEKLLEDHFQTIIRVGVADGYREVTPEKKLGTWLDYHPNMPIEQTLGVHLKTYQETLADRIEKQVGDRQKKTFLDVVGFNKEQQLDMLKRAYADIAKDWLEGKSTIRDVKEALEERLKKGAASTERLFRTETTRWFNESRLTYFKEETSVSHVQIFAVTDGRTSEICESRNGFVIEISKASFKKYLPPFHPNCRTVQRGLIAGFGPHDRLISRGEAIPESRFVKPPKGWAA